MKICRNIKLFALLFLILSAYSINASYAVHSGRLEYNSVLFDYSKFNSAKIKKDADLYFELFLKSEAGEMKNTYLYAAMSKYYLLTKAAPSKIEPYVQLGRIYDYINKPRLAKENFSRAKNINSESPFTNFYFGEFYFKRRDYKKALKHYNVAYNNGYNNNYELNLRLATIYEKFADLVNAKKFYEVSYSMKPDTEIQQKIQLLNELNYDKTEYYHSIRE